MKEKYRNLIRIILCLLGVPILPDEKDLSEIGKDSIDVYND